MTFYIIHSLLCTDKSTDISIKCRSVQSLVKLFHNQHMYHTHNISVRSEHKKLLALNSTSLAYVITLWLQL